MANLCQLISGVSHMLVQNFAMHAKSKFFVFNFCIWKVPTQWRKLVTPLVVGIHVGLQVHKSAWHCLLNMNMVVQLWCAKTNDVVAT